MPVISCQRAGWIVLSETLSDGLSIGGVVSGDVVTKTMERAVLFTPKLGD